MKSLDRSKRRAHLHFWKKALVHFALFFVIGFFTGFAPTSPASFFYSSAAATTAAGADPIIHSREPLDINFEDARVNRTLMAKISPPTPAAANPAPLPPPPPPGAEAEESEFIESEDGESLAAESNSELLSSPKALLIVVTTTQSNDRYRDAFLQRLAHALRLVPPPMLWIVVQAHEDAPATAATLRTTGVMYRHLTFKENFTDPSAEADYQRNVALSHIEYHRLTGIVHFASASNVYDLGFFQEIREIEAFGAWPVAIMSTNRKRVLLDGPICRSSKITGWSLGEFTGEISASIGMNSAGISMKPSKINLSGFAFNSSILWDPERWGRSISLPDTSQDSLKFVLSVVLEDDGKLKGIPADCSRIMLWHLHIPKVISLPFHQRQNQRRR